MRVPAPTPARTLQTRWKDGAARELSGLAQSVTDELQLRIVTYQEKTEALNEDQKKAIASKPALEATVKELQELLVILKVRSLTSRRFEPR